MAKNEIKPLENRFFTQRDIDSITDYYKHVSNVNPSGIVIYDNCKICNHPLRAQSESLWETTQDAEKVLEFFNEAKKTYTDLPDILLSNIKTHMKAHYATQMNNLMLLEYSNRITAALNKKITDDHRLEVLMAQMQLQLDDIACDQDMDNSKKSVAMTGLAREICNIMQHQSKMRGDINTTSVLMEQFQAVFMDIISSQQDPRIKQELIKALQSFAIKLDQAKLP